MYIIGKVLIFKTLFSINKTELSEQYAMTFFRHFHFDAKPVVFPRFNSPGCFISAIALPQTDECFFTLSIKDNAWLYLDLYGDGSAAVSEEDEPITELAGFASYFQESQELTT